MESYEKRLNRRWSQFTDDEVRRLMEGLRDHPTRKHDDRAEMLLWDEVWREYARRTYGGPFVCKRCGSDNHHADNHFELTGED